MRINLKRGRALIVVAHPDDETIWMGGTMLAHPEIHWTVFVLTRSYDQDRAPRFYRAVKALRARGIISNMEDFGRLGFRASIPVVEAHLVKKLPQKKFDYIFTHGKNGEYGHDRHRSVHIAVKKLLKKHSLQASAVFNFAYRPTLQWGYAIPSKKADFESKLLKSVFNKKIKIIQDIYGFTPDSFEYKSCSKIEKFNLIKI